MPNTYVNKVVKSDGTTLIDLTSDTVTSAAHIVSGRIGHLADGSQVTGTGSGGGAASIEDVSNATGTTAVIDGTDASHIVADYDLSETALGSDGSVDLSEAIEALTTYSNEVTGESDTTLSAAVATLADGYGSGGVTLESVLDGSVSGDVTVTSSRSIPNLFQDCSDITSITANNMTTLYAQEFSGCSSMTSVTLNSVTTINANNIFYGCTNLASINIPSLTSFNGQGVFTNCTSLRSLVIGKHGSTTSLTSSATLTWTAFNKCTLTALDISMQAKITGNTSMTSLGALILRSTTISTLSNTSYLPGSVSTIYVPSSTISTYQSEANWSTLYSGGSITFVAIEGSAYENYYADGTAIS